MERVPDVKFSNSQTRCLQAHRWRGCLMFVQSLAVMRQQKVIESGIKVPLCHLSPLLCQYNIFYSLSQVWSVHHSVTQSHTVPCTVSPQVGASYRECRSDKGFTVEPNTRPQHHSGLEGVEHEHKHISQVTSTSHKYKSKSTQRCVWTQAAVQRDTDSHLRSFPTLVFFVPWHKDVCSNALCAHYCHFDFKNYIYFAPPPFKMFFYLDKQWTLVQIYANSTNTPMDTCMSNIVKNSFKGLDTVQVQSLADSSQCCW